jgi:ComF family protein
VSLASGYPTVCISCIKERPFYERVYVHGDYDGVLKKAINCMKFNRVRRLGIPLGELLCSVSLPEVDAVVPVPLSKERIVSRGFNQAHLLALSLSRKLKIPFRSDILVKIRNTVPQSLLSRKERLRSPAGAFSINRNIKKGLPHRILIVDDVMTTGATMNECARVLRVAGVRVVYGVVLARACSD